MAAKNEDGGGSAAASGKSGGGWGGRGFKRAPSPAPSEYETIISAEIAITELMVKIGLFRQIVSAEIAPTEITFYDSIFYYTLPRPV